MWSPGSIILTWYAGVLLLHLICQNHGIIILYVNVCLIYTISKALAIQTLWGHDRSCTCGSYKTYKSASILDKHFLIRISTPVTFAIRSCVPTQSLTLSSSHLTNPEDTMSFWLSHQSGQSFYCNYCSYLPVRHTERGESSWLSGRLIRIDWCMNISFFNFYCYNSQCLLSWTVINNYYVTSPSPWCPGEKGH